MRQSLALNEQLTAGRVLLAQALAMSDSLDEAVVEYRRVLDVEPDNAKALRGITYCLIRTARYQEAMEAYRGWTELEPENADAWAGLGNAWLGLQDLDRAEEAFLRARALDAQNPTMKKGMELIEKARGATPAGP